MHICIILCPVLLARQVFLTNRWVSDSLRSQKCFDHIWKWGRMHIWHVSYCRRDGRYWKKHVFERCSGRRNKTYLVLFQFKFPILFPFSHFPSCWVMSLNCNITTVFAYLICPLAYVYRGREITTKWSKITMVNWNFFPRQLWLLKPSISVCDRILVYFRAGARALHFRPQITRILNRTKKLAQCNWNERNGAMLRRGNRVAAHTTFCLVSLDERNLAISTISSILSNVGSRYSIFQI